MGMECRCHVRPGLDQGQARCQAAHVQVQRELTEKSTHHGDEAWSLTVPASPPTCARSQNHPGQPYYPNIPPSEQFGPDDRYAILQELFGLVSLEDAKRLAIEPPREWRRLRGRDDRS